MDFDKESQQRILRVAADKNEGRPTEELDERIARVLELHPEFDSIWEEGDMASIPREINGMIVNPFVHTVLHVIIDRQLQVGDPDYVAAAHTRLTEQGMDSHEALHAIIAIYANLHFAGTRKSTQFDSLDYETQVNSLAYKTE
ncbi:MAG: DUF1841 family protein [Nitrospinaceae bacterium]|jgi:hypothetical protein|nr:DUF1841 family protein [Nitrospinaceae bacterium]